jgi:hypothetical protein
MSSSSSFMVMVVEGLHFIRQKKALRAPACSLTQYESFQLEEGHQLLNTSVGDPDPHPDPDPYDSYVFGPPGSHSDPLVTSTDPAPDPCIIKKNSRKPFLSTFCMTFFLQYLEE